jgi:hypothetical protein
MLEAIEQAKRQDQDVMYQLLTTAFLILCGILLYRFREPILVRLRRFDAQNIARQQAEARDRRDGLAHFRHTLALAEDQVEEVQTFEARDKRTGLPVTRYVFECEIFASADEAEAARQRAIVVKARDFYRELPVALSRRGDGRLH